MDCQEKWTGHWKKAAKEGGIFLCSFSSEEPLYYILYTMETILCKWRITYERKVSSLSWRYRAMTLSLLVVPAAAVSFTDMTNHWARRCGVPGHQGSQGYHATPLLQTEDDRL